MWRYAPRMSQGSPIYKRTPCRVASIPSSGREKILSPGAAVLSISDVAQINHLPLQGWLFLRS